MNNALGRVRPLAQQIPDQCLQGLGLAMGPFTYLWSIVFVIHAAPAIAIAWFLWQIGQRLRKRWSPVRTGDATGTTQP